MLRSYLDVCFEIDWTIYKSPVKFVWLVLNKLKKWKLVRFITAKRGFYTEETAQTILPAKHASK